MNFHCELLQERYIKDKKRSHNECTLILIKGENEDKRLVIFNILIFCTQTDLEN